MNDITGAQDIVRTLQASGVRSAVFDIDGTLLDSMPIWSELGARYLKSVGRTPSPDLGEILFPMTIEEGVSYLKKTYALPETEQEIRTSLMHITARFYTEEVQLKKGTYALLCAMSAADIPMALATIGESSLEEAALQRLGVRSLFRKMFVCEDYHTTKREGRIYEICASYLGTRPEETLVAEDLLQAVLSAHTAGFMTAGVSDRASANDEAELRRVCDFWFPDFTRMDRQSPTIL